MVAGELVGGPAVGVGPPSFRAARAARNDSRSGPS